MCAAAILSGGDDGLGQLVGQQLASRFAGDDRLTVLISQPMTLDLGETIAEHDQVLFVNAVHDEGTPRLICRPILAANTSLPPIFSHSVTPGQLLAICQAVYNRCPVASIWGVTSARFELGIPLARQTSRLLPLLVSRIVQHLLDKRAVPAGDNVSARRR